MLPFKRHLRLSLRQSRQDCYSQRRRWRGNAHLRRKTIFKKSAKKKRLAERNNFKRSKKSNWVIEKSYLCTQQVELWILLPQVHFAWPVFTGGCMGFLYGDNELSRNKRFNIVSPVCAGGFDFQSPVSGVVAVGCFHLLLRQKEVKTSQRVGGLCSAGFSILSM